MSSLPEPRTEASKTAKARLRRELGSAPIVAMGDYAYVTHPVLDGFPNIEPDFVTALGASCADLAFPDRSKAQGVDGVITVEAMGIPLAFEVAKELKAPLFIARKKEYKTAGEIVVRRRTAYSEANLSFNGLQEGKNYWFVDTLLSTGSTLKASMLAIKLAGAKVGGAVFLVSKMDEAQGLKLSQITGSPIFCLLTLAVMDASKESAGEAHGYRVRVSDGFHVSL